jgi:transcriptional regulator with XRE-family HTH domain
MELRHRVLIARREKHMRQEDLAKAVGMAANTLARFERGEISDIKAQVLGKMAQVLEVSADYLLGLQPEEVTTVRPPRKRQKATTSARAS